MPRTISKTIDAEDFQFQVDTVARKIYVTFLEVTRENGVVVNSKRISIEDATEDMPQAFRDNLFTRLEQLVTAFRNRRYI